MKNLIQPDPNLLLPLHILFKIQATGIFYGSPAEIILHNFQIFIFSIFQNLFLSNDVDQRRSKTVRSHFCGREFVGACRLSLPTPVQLDQRTSRQTHLRENLQSANTCAQNKTPLRASQSLASSSARNLFPMSEKKLVELYSQKKSTRRLVGLDWQFSVKLVGPRGSASGCAAERRTREKRKMMPFHIFLGLEKKKKNLVEHKSALPNQRQPLFLSCYLYYMCCPDFNSTTRRKGMAGVGNSGISRTTSNMHPHKRVNLLTEKQQNKTNKQIKQ